MNASPDNPTPAASPARAGTLLETFLVFLRLGCTSFGGPVAHLGYYQNELIQRRRWASEAVYAEIVALCQFLPGPASSQVALVLGYRRSGLLGGILGWIAFTAPSVVLMTALASGLDAIHLAHAGWLAGLKVAAVAVVAQAVWIMGRKLCPDLIRVLLMLGTALILKFHHETWLQPVLIVAGALLGLVTLGKSVSPSHDEKILRAQDELPRPLAALSLILFGGLLATSLLWHGSPGLADAFARFYRTGALVFGGGHVVLPLLEGEFVRTGQIPPDVFLAGYGAAQAVPGPLFTFASYLGANLISPYPRWLMALWCQMAILLPSLFLILGVLPFWSQLSHNAGARRALQGANAAVVGLLLAAFANPVLPGGVTSVASALLALAAFIALQFAKAPNWLVVLACALAGQCLL